MIAMTLSSRHRIRNSSPGGLRPSTLPLGHGGSPQYWLSHVDGEETFFVSFKPPRLGTEPRTLAWKAAVLTTTLGPPSRMSLNIRSNTNSLAESTSSKLFSYKLQTSCIEFLANCTLYKVLKKVSRQSKFKSLLDEIVITFWYDN